jgi:hypothetical protein
MFDAILRSGRARPARDHGLVRLEGRIAASGFSSGHRFVVGAWDDGPLGPMADVMWADPGGRRTLLAPDDAVAAFVGGIYSFDALLVVPFAVEEAGASRLALRAGPLEIALRAGASLRVFALRPRWLRRRRAWVRLEDALLRPAAGRLLLGGAPGVRASGVNPSGVREWYCIDAYSPLAGARAWLDGEDLGRMSPLEPAVGFGFSEFPRRPALVACSPLLLGAESRLPRRATG